VSPERQLAITLGLEEEDGRDTLHALNKVHTNEEAADCEGWTDFLEVLTPVRQLAITGSFFQDLIKFSVGPWCKLHDQDPNQQITPRHVEMMEEVVFYPSPANHITGMSL